MIYSYIPSCNFKLIKEICFILIKYFTHGTMEDYIVANTLHNYVHKSDIVTVA